MIVEAGNLTVKQLCTSSKIPLFMFTDDHGHYNGMTRLSDQRPL